MRQDRRPDIAQDPSQATPVTRRGLLRGAATLPLLGGGWLSQWLASPGRIVWFGSTWRLANGAELRTRQAYRVFADGTRRLIEDVQWTVRHGQTVEGSTIWLVHRWAEVPKWLR